MLRVEVRQGNALDIDAILEINAAASPKDIAYLKEQLRKGTIHVAFSQDGVLGYIVWNHEFFKAAFVWHCVVRESWRRLGIGSQLFAYVETACKNEPIYSSTNRSNAPMHAFLRERGYKEVGELDIDPGDPEVFYRKNPVIA